jgi:hypothetical protein
MLRITTQSTPDSVTLKLEGRLAGPWVDEARRCWHCGGPEEKRKVHVDLRGVTYVDGEGEKLLAELYEQGADFLACDCQMKAVVSEIANWSARSQTREGENHDSSSARTTA